MQNYTIIEYYVTKESVKRVQEVKNLTKIASGTNESCKAENNTKKCENRVDVVQTITKL